MMVSSRSAFASACLLLGACATPHQAMPSATPAPCTGGASGVTFCIESIAPPAGAVVTADSVFRVSVRYHVPQFQPGRWHVVLVFATTAGRWHSGPIRDRGSWMLSDSAGVFNGQQSFGDVWHNAAFARPFRIYVLLNQNQAGRPGISGPVVTLGPFDYNVAPPEH